MTDKINYSKLTGLFLENFQAIKSPTFIKLNGLVFLYGPNSAGKSSIIDALNILKILVGMKDEKKGPSYYLRSMSERGNSSVGLEICVGELDSYFNKKMIEWEGANDNSIYQADGYKKFFKNAYGKNIQIEFSSQFETIKVAIDSNPLFEIHGMESVDYTFAHKKITNGEIELDENIFFGKLKIYKNNSFAKNLFGNAFDLISDESSGSNKSYHHDLFVENNDEVLIVNGIRYDGGLLSQNLEVDVDQSVTNLLFGDYARNISDDVSKRDADENLIYDMFSEKSKNFKKFQNQRTRLYWQLIEIAKEARLLVQGLYFHMESALEISHIRGDRTLMNSKKPIYIGWHNDLYEFLSSDHQKSISEYAESCSKKFENIHVEVNKIKFTDFINHALKNYLKSLKSYKIVVDVYDIKARKKTNDFHNDDMLLYINLLDANKRKLGFQDVGSGLSYIMPILTSLWASRFSIVEQPELHLHPKAQCEMADVFIAAFNANSSALIESHSEHILLRVLRRVRENNDGKDIGELRISNDDVNIYYFEPKADGFTSVKKIRVDKFGELMDVWPGGFFSEREGELFYE